MLLLSLKRPFVCDSQDIEAESYFVLTILANVDVGSIVICYFWLSFVTAVVALLAHRSTFPALAARLNHRGSAVDSPGFLSTVLR